MSYYSIFSALPGKSVQGARKLNRWLSHHLTCVAKSDKIIVQQNVSDNSEIGVNKAVILENSRF